MHADEELLGPKDPREWERKVDEYLSSSRDQAKWKRPPSSRDKLIDAPEGKGQVTPHPKDRLRRSGVPRVFHGRIGAANVVLADPVSRDYLREKLALKAVAMEDSGLADASWVAAIGYLVVRGTCDYCNSTKNDDWHHYAALIAAAYARTVVQYLHPRSLTVAKSVGPTLLPAMLEGSRQSPNTSVEPSINQSHIPSPVQSERPPDQQLVTSHRVEAQPVSTPRLQSTVDAHATACRTESNDWKAQALVPELVQITKVQNLVDQIESLLKAGRFKESDASAGELERLLKMLPRHGAQVRAGWIMLARLEVQFLQIAKQSNREIDASRLRSLYQEAENVID